MIPPAHQAPCALCSRALDIAAPGTHQWTSGWVKLRDAGGGHAIALPERSPRWAHGNCVQLAARGLLSQPALFASPTA